MLTGKRIIFVLPGFNMGGAERQALLLARHFFQEQQADVQVWGFNGPGRVAELCEMYGVPWRVVRTKWSRNRTIRVKGVVRFAQTLRQAEPDLLLPYTLSPNVICGLIWRLTSTRLCIWNQRDAGLNHDNIAPQYQRWSARLATRLVSNSQPGVEFLKQNLGVKPEKISLIHNGVALEQPKADKATWRNRLGVDKDCFLACMVANLHQSKDHATLLKAWQLVVQTAPHAVLLLAGYLGSTYDSLQSLVQQSQLGQNIRFLGEVKDIPGVLAAVDLGVFSSVLEGCPNGVLECMASGLAVVGTNIPGIRETVGPSGYHFLAPPGDAETLANRILELIANPKLSTDLGSLNRRRIETEFNPRQMCEQNVTLLEHNLRL